MSTQHSETIEVGYVVRTVARNWRVVAAVTALGILGAAAVIAFAPKRYTGKTTVILKSGGTQSGGGTSLLSQVTGLGDITTGLLSGKSSMDTEIEVLSSRAVVGVVVDSLRLQAKVKGKVALPAAQTISHLDLPGSFAAQTYEFRRVADGRYRFSGDSAAGEMTPGQPAALPVGRVTFAAGATLPAEFKLILRDRSDAIDWTARRLTVDEEKGDVASITYKGDDPVTAAAMPNMLLDVYFVRRQGTDRGINQRRVEFLMAKSDSMGRAVANAAQSLRREQESSGILDPATTARVELERTSGMRARLTDLLVAQGALRQLVDKITSGTLSPRELAAYPPFIGSPVINNLVGQLSDFETRRTALLASHAETDRDVVALDKSRAAVEAQLLPYAKTYGESLERQRADLEATLAKSESALGRLPRAAESTTRLENEVEALTKMFGGLQAQIVEAKLAAIGEGGDVRALDRAMPPKRASFPSPLITAGVGTFGGVVLGLMAALLFGAAGRWVRDPLEIERATGIAAMQFDPAAPLLLTNAASRTLLLVPTEAAASTTPVANRLAHTATSRSLSAVVLELPPTAAEVDATIARLEGQHDVVIVQLSGLESDTAAAALQHGRPVLLVTPARTDRRRLVHAVQLLRRLEIPVAGIVVGEPGLNGRRLKG